MAQLSIAKHPQKIHYFAESLHPSNLVLKPINMILIGVPNQTISQHTDLAAIWEKVLQQLLPASKDLFKVFGTLITVTNEQAVVAMKSSTMQQIASGKVPELTKVFSDIFGRSMVVTLEVLGKNHFQMGSPETEIDRFESESPQHEVTVPSFFMSEYLIADPHWIEVSRMPRVDIELRESPSYFNDRRDRPVENVNWFEAVEFCERLSQHSGRRYRLPTEAEWEYACRAGTTTPFHYGETITTDLANYDSTDDPEGRWYGSLDRGSKGIYRQKTTPVNNFPPNAFGLYDMHGNVWEWCLDHWHDNYQGAPTDSSAWLSDDKNARRVLRGGSWCDIPRYFRSAARYYGTPGYRSNIIGFRVVCEIPRTKASRFI
jgi:formylglycine-generating enzyme required for sulfatase activity